MTYPSFTSGDILTAADMNAVGLWKIGSGTLAGATTNFQGCFTSTYRNYRIVIDQGGSSGTSDFYMRFLQGASETTGATANNYWAYTGILSNSANNPSTAQANIAQYLGVTITGGTTAGASIMIDLYNPQTANKTHATVQALNLVPGAYSARSGGFSFDTNAVFDGFAIKSLTAVTLTGNVTIYGYRN